MKEFINRLKQKAKALKKDVMALYLAYKRPEVPWYAKLFAAIVVGYALSPIDLIPDFIPVLGYLDDVILIPLGITLALKMIPQNIMEECRAQAEEIFKNNRPASRITAVIIILFWVVITGYIVFKLLHTLL